MRHDLRHRQRARAGETSLASTGDRQRFTYGAIACDTQRPHRIDHAGQRPARRADAVDDAGDLPFGAIGAAALARALPSGQEPRCAAAAPAQRRCPCGSRGRPPPRRPLRSPKPRSRRDASLAAVIGVEGDQTPKATARVQGPALPRPLEPVRPAPDESCSGCSGSAAWAAGSVAALVGGAAAHAASGSPGSRFASAQARSPCAKTLCGPLHAEEAGIGLHLDGGDSGRLHPLRWQPRG